MPIVIDEPSLPKEVLCNACHHVWDPEDASACSTCENIYCAGCISGVKSKPPLECPACKSAEGFGPVHRTVRNLADAQVRVKCVNFVYGCDWTGIRPTAAAHEGSCTRNRPPAHLFVDAPPEDLLCPICHEVFIAPTQLATCGHIFCDPCITLAFANACFTEKSCPVCHQRAETTEPVPKQISAALDRLQVRCCYAAPHPRQCAFVGKQSDYLAHVSTCGGVPAPSAPQPSAPKTTGGSAECTMRVLNAAPHIAGGCKEAQTVTTMLHVEAPTLASLEERRQGITLSAVIDVSGSMSGEKLSLVKESLKFMISQLSPQDSFGIVTFATEIEIPMNLTLMTSYAKDSAMRIVEKIDATTCTNLSGGLMAGIDQAARVTNVVPKTDEAEEQKPLSTKSSGFFDCMKNIFSSSKKAKEASSALSTPTTVGSAAVMLFTDGQANEGIVDRTALLAALKKRLESDSHIVVHTFGFGTDHDAVLLQGIAEQSQGSYYYIKDKNVLKESFADCLGGLVSVVCTNLTLRLQVVDPEHCKVLQIMTSFPAVTDERSRSTVITLRDLYSGEARDFPVSLEVTGSAAVGSRRTLLTWTLTYNSTIDEKPHTTTCDSVIAYEAGKYSGPVEIAVDEQCNRYLAAVAIEEARKDAENRNFAAAQEKIRSLQERIVVSDSAQTTYVKNLNREMDVMFANVASEQCYKAEGTRSMAQAQSRHTQQRCVDASEEGMYQTSFKLQMKRSAK